LERIDLRGKRGLDIGSGSGILAIAMEKLGAEEVVAFDNDPDAYGPLRDNRMRNGARFPIFIGGVEALRKGVFDVVTMNIIPEVILPLLPQVKRHVRGHLILSGILAVRRDEVVAAAGKLEAESVRGEWWAGMFTFA
ncbi:MAG TPA: 50S ribosomal protein L11 methyltransferase, partial [Thermoanaerobaculia bacterium]|nr:50S ribosomal protein L11 methyltransferase [Thermoanaerobaculia bacterium]